MAADMKLKNAGAEKEFCECRTAKERLLMAMSKRVCLSSVRAISKSI